MRRLRVRLASKIRRLRWRLDSLLPGIGLGPANARILKSYERRNAWRETGIRLIAERLVGWPDATQEARTSYDEELARHESIEQKAMSLVSTTGVGAGLIAGAGAIGLFGPVELSNRGQIIVSSILSVPLLCLVIGLYFATRAWRVSRIELVGPDQVLSGNGLPPTSRSLPLAAERLFATKLNQLLILIRTNYVSCAEAWIARGALLVPAAVIVISFLALTTGLLTNSERVPSCHLSNLPVRVCVFGEE